MAMMTMMTMMMPMTIGMMRFLGRRGLAAQLADDDWHLRQPLLCHLVMMVMMMTMRMMIMMMTQ